MTGEMVQKNGVATGVPGGDGGVFHVKESSWPVETHNSDFPALIDSAEVEHAVRVLIENVGEDTERSGLRETPARVAESLAFLTQGYHQDPREIVGDALFAERFDELVLVRDVEFYSLCEHHLLPFFGLVHIGYVPDGRIVGLSKLPRIVDVFARRFQVQERLTREIAECIQELIQPRGVGVMIEANHLCMQMRGVQKQDSRTVTTTLLGTLREDDRARSEFLALVQGGKR